MQTVVLLNFVRAKKQLGGNCIDDWQEIMEASTCSIDKHSKKWSDSGCILKIQPTESSDGFSVGCEEQEGKS